MVRACSKTRRASPEPQVRPPAPCFTVRSQDRDQDTPPDIRPMCLGAPDFRSGSLIDDALDEPLLPASFLTRNTRNTRELACPLSASVGNRYHVKQGCTQQPCTSLVVCCFPRVTERACAPPRSASPKVRCRGVVSLSWGARGRAPFRKQGGAGASSALKKHQAAQKQEQEQKQAKSSVEQKSPSRSRRIAVAKVLRTQVHACLTKMRVCARENACVRR